MNTLCLFKVTVKGLTMARHYQSVYVLSESMDIAYQTYRDFLDKEDIGSDYDRELEKIELVARFYTDAERHCEMLFIADTAKDIIERSKLCQKK